MSENEFGNNQSSEVPQKTSKLETPQTIEMMNFTYNSVSSIYTYNSLIIVYCQYTYNRVLTIHYYK